MNFDELQKAWQSQNASAGVKIDPELLLKEVRRNYLQFRVMLFWRDAREVFAGWSMAVFFSYYGFHYHESSWYLTAVACFGVGVFMLIDRWLQSKREPHLNDSLRKCVYSALEQVRHQIWLLENVFWWYLLPILSAVSCTTFSSLFHQQQVGGFLLRCGVCLFCLCFYGSVCWFIYVLNQRVVKKELKPRREELEMLATSFE